MDEEIKFIEPLIAFIESCPFLNTTSKVVVVPFSPDTMQGNGLSYNGLSAPDVRKDTAGDITVINQANFTLNILRHLIDEISNKELAEFISKFEQWVLLQSLKGKAPRFGSTDYDEQLWADGGFLWEIVQDAQLPYAAYQTNIRVKYMIEIESGGY